MRGKGRGCRWVDRITASPQCGSSKVKLISVDRLARQVCSVPNWRQEMTHPAVCRYVRGMNLKTRRHRLWPRFSRKGCQIICHTASERKKNNWVCYIRWQIIIFLRERWLFFGSSSLLPSSLRNTHGINKLRTQHCMTQFSNLVLFLWILLFAENTPRPEDVFGRWGVGHRWEVHHLFVNAGGRRRCQVCINLQQNGVYW